MADIVHRIGIEAPAGKVYDALTTQEGLSGWWTTNVKAQPKVGATIEFRFPDSGPDFKVVDLIPGKKVKWQCSAGPDEWTGTDVTFDLRQDHEETVVFFRHAGWNETGEFMGHCSSKWGYFMLSLKSLIEEGKGTPFPNDRKLGAWG
jgi:uncharacterized protein YndB with AHSA1/START domain